MKNSKTAVSGNHFLFFFLQAYYVLLHLPVAGSPNRQTTTSQQTTPSAPTASPTKYPRLVELLQSQQWIEADKETANIISELERNARLKETGGFPESDPYFNFGSKVSRISCNDFNKACGIPHPVEGGDG
jgi:hypothetical protein